MKDYKDFNDSELFIALVGAVGTDLDYVVKSLKERLAIAKYTVIEIKISKDIICELIKVGDHDGDHFKRINDLMDAGNAARKVFDDNSVLAKGAAYLINVNREKGEHNQLKIKKRHAYIINSLKHPKEVTCLREIYPESFFLIGVNADEGKRFKRLNDNLDIDEDKAKQLMERDEKELLTYGQQVTDTFHMSDFFIRLEDDDPRLKANIKRVVDSLFGNPFITPTFEEYAMFLAFASSLRSGDLSRQIGAVITRKDDALVTGTNDCPKPGGGTYWPYYDNDKKDVVDIEGGRDYTIGHDANRKIQEDIINDIKNRLIEQFELLKEDGGESKVLDALRKSKIMDLTEYGRVVHAEMEALLACGRNNICTRDAELFCTTYPCHNCAKHIIAAGIKRVVYIEPYQKSRAKEQHKDAITCGFHDKGGDAEDKKVRFEPFVGIGPRRFFDIFSMRFSSGKKVDRKKEDLINKKEWDLAKANLRFQMIPASYLDLEASASSIIYEKLKSE